LRGFDGDYNSLSNQPTIPTNTSYLTNDSGFITNPDDADFDPNNEIQNLTISGNYIGVSGGLGDSISAVQPAIGDYLYWNGVNWIGQSIAGNTDNQNLGNGGKSGNDQTLVIQNGTGVTFSVADGDSVATNELQTISASGGTSPQIDLSIGGGNVKILGTGGTTVNQAGNAITINSTTGTTYTAGTGIDITTGTISNTSLNTDDQQLTYNSGSQTLSLSTTTTPSVVTLDVNDADADPNNEIQTLSFTSPNLTISGTGGNTVDLSGLTNDGDWTKGVGTIYNTSDSIGIGTNAPEALLHISRYNTPQFKIGNDNQPAYEWSFDVDPIANMTIRNEGNGTPIDFIYLNSSNNNIGIGTNNPTARLHHEGSLRLDNLGSAVNTGYVLTATSTNGDAEWQSLPAASNDWSILGNSGTISGTNFIGTTDAQDLDFRTNNQERLRITQKGQLEILNTGTSVFIGEGAGDNDDLNNRQNTFVGHQAGEANTTGNWNTSLGYGALVDNVTGTSNTALGRVALAYSTGSSNTATGTYALFWGTTGSGNTATGTYAGQTITTGSNNTFLGYQSDATNTNLTNATAIGYNAKVSLSNSLILGNNANVGIGISSPLAKLHLDGTLRLDNLGGTAPSGGEVLTYNSGTGTAQWQTAAGDADWTINGFDMYNSFTGNIGVGVGTSTAMLGKFTIKDGNTSTNGMDGVFLDIINTSTNTANTIAGIRFGNYDASTSNQFIPGGIFWNSDGAPGGMGDMHFVNNSSTGLARLQFSRMVIKKDGKIGIGTSTPTELLHLQSADSDLDIETNDGAESSSIHFKKSRGTVAAPTILSSVDYFANIQFMGYDGSTYHTGARIEGSVDGTPAADNMPGKIVLYTRPAGVGAAEIERMRIDNQGEVGIGISSNMSGKLHVSSSVATWTTSNSAVYGDVYGSIQSSRGVAGVSNATGLYGIGVYGYSQGAATNNYGVYGFATGGTNNYAGYFASGDVYIQNNLGIGVTAPSEKLDISGNAEVTGEYKYASAKTHYYSVGANLLPNTTNATLYLYPSGNYTYFNSGTAGTTYYATANVNLPDGAIITKFDVWLYDNDGTENASASLLYQTHGVNSSSSVTSLTTSVNNSVAQQVSSGALSHTVDNSSYAYKIRFDGQGSNSNIRFYSARITYTVTKAD
jgi:hypothetical protein